MDESEILEIPAWDAPLPEWIQKEYEYCVKSRRENMLNQIRMIDKMRWTSSQNCEEDD